MRRVWSVGKTIDGYVDGVPAGSTPAPGSVTKRGTALRFGADGVGNGDFIGKLDEVRVYDRPLSAAEIATLAAP